MLDDRFMFKEDFAPVSYQQWRALAESQLQGQSFETSLVTPTYEGIDLQPLYTGSGLLDEVSRQGLPEPPRSMRTTYTNGVRHIGWDLRQEHAHPDLQLTNQLIHGDLQGGVVSLLLRLDAAARAGIDPDEPAAVERAGHDGLTAYHWQDLQSTLRDVDLTNVAVALDAGAAFLPAAAQLVSLWQRRGLAADQSRGAFNADPLSVLAREGHLPYSADTALDMLADLAEWTHQHLPGVTPVAVDTSVYHHAGATETLDIAIALATGVAYLRAMEQRGMPIDAAARQVLFRMSVDTDLFLSIAKLRAARWLWWQVINACGAAPASGVMRLHARTSERVLTRRDAHLNLLRNAIGVLAAGMGGSQIITSVPFDARLGLPDEFSRRLARNTLLILQEEAHLHRVVDPAGGSWFVEQLTRQFAQQAWQLFQRIEQQGGMLAALTSGWVAGQIEAGFARRAQDIAERRRAITGVTDFADQTDTRPVSKVVDTHAIRSAAAARLVAIRRESPALAMLPTANNRTQVAVAAAADGASLGQLSRALGFQADATSFSALEPRNLAEPFEAPRE